MLIQAVALLTISTGCVLSAPQFNTEAAIQNDIRSIAENLVAAARSMPAFGQEPSTRARRPSPAALAKIVKDLNTNNLSNDDLTQINQLFQEYTGSTASGATADMKQERRRRAAKDETSSPAEKQTGDSQLSSNDMNAIETFLKTVQEQYQARAAQAGPQADDLPLPAFAKAVEKQMRIRETQAETNSLPLAVDFSKPAEAFAKAAQKQMGIRAAQAETNSLPLAVDFSKPVEAFAKAAEKQMKIRGAQAETNSLPLAVDFSKPAEAFAKAAEKRFETGVTQAGPQTSALSSDDNRKAAQFLATLVNQSSEDAEVAKTTNAE